MGKELLKTTRGKKRLLESLEKNLGVVTRACKDVGISRRTFYTWRATDPEFAAAVEELQEVCLDFAEAQLLKQIKEQNTTATIFYLKTKGKKRGYVERIEQDISGLERVNVTIENPYNGDE